MTSPAKLRTALRSTTAIAGALLFIAAVPAAAQNLPDVGNVTTTTSGLSGGAPGSTTPTFSTSGAPGAQTLRVDLRDNRTILNWGGSGFRIEAGGTVDFKDSRATSGVTGRTDNIAVLNRDLSGGPSIIAGTLRSDPNVAVYVVNRNGMFFGSDASVDTGSLFAMAGNITNDNDFLNGSTTMRLSGGVDGASVFANPGSRFRTRGSTSSDGGRLGDLVFVGAKTDFKGFGGSYATATVDGDMALIAASDVTIQNAPGSPLSFTIHAGGVTNNSPAIEIGGNITARNITVAAARAGTGTGDGGIAITGNLTATGATATDRGIVLTAGAAASGVTFSSAPVDNNPAAPIRTGGAITQVGVLISAKDIWINAASGTKGDGSLQATGNIDIAGAYFAAGGTHDQISTRATVTGGSISLHTEGYFKGKVKATTGNFTVDSTAALIFLDTLEVAGNLTGTAGNIRAPESVTVTGNIDLTTTGDQYWEGVVDAGAFKAVSQNGSVSAINLTTRIGDIHIRASDTAIVTSGSSAGGIDIGTGRTLGLGTITAVGNIKLVSGTPYPGEGDFGYGSISATGANSDVTITAYRFTGSTNGTITAGRDVSITSFQGNLGSITGGRNVAITGSFGATLVKATTGSVTIGNANSLDRSAGIGTLYAGTSATLYGQIISIDSAQVGTNLTVTTSTTSGPDHRATIKDAQVGGNLQVSAGTVNLTGNITVTGTLTATGGSGIRLGQGTLDVTSIKADGQIALSAGSSGIVSDGAVTVQSNADGVGGETLRLETTGGINLAAVSTLVGGTASQRTNIEIRTGTNNSVSLGSVTARGFRSVVGNGAFADGLTVSSILNLYRDVTLTDSTSITAQTINAGNVSVTNGDLSLNATHSTLTVTSAGASGNLSLTAGNSGVTVTTATAGGNVALTAGNGNVTATTATATAGNLTASATNGNITLGGTAGTGGATAGGDINFTATGTLTLRSNMTAGGALSASGSTVTISNSTSNLLTLKAAGALTLTSTTGTITTPTTPVTLQSNSDGVGSEALTLNAATTINFNPSTTLLGGTARQSDVQIRNPDTSFVNIGVISARSLLGATGTDPFTTGITRNAQVILRQVSLTNSLYASGTSVTINNATVSNGNIDVRSGAALSLSGTYSASGDVNVQTSSGNLTIGAAGSVSGTNVILSTPAAFINNAGANAVTATNRWAIYSANPDANTFGGLNSNNYAIWGGTLATRAPDSFSGNRYVFAISPTLTVSAVNYTKTYGDDLTFPASQALLYTVTGMHPGVTGAFQADNLLAALSGSLVITSGGLAPRASVAGGPYAINISAGTLSSPTGHTIVIGNSGATITVNPKTLTISYLANSKRYDGTTAGTGTVQIDGVVAGDTVTASGTTWTFDNKNAGIGRIVTVAGTTISGDISNYSFTLPSGTVTADILKAQLGVDINASNKTYDGTVAATGTVRLLGVVGTEDVVLTGGTLEFANKNAGASIAVFLRGTLGLTGADAGNYELGTIEPGHAQIFRKAITATYTADSKTYDGTVTTTGTVTISGVLAGDTVGTGGSVFSFANKAAGAGKAVTLSGTILTGADADNYTLTVNGTATADVLQKALTGVVTVNNRTYDGTTGATGTVTLNGVVAGDTVGTTGSIFTFDNRNAGTGKTVTVSGTTLTGGDAANYTLTVGSGFADILKKALTGTVTVNNKTYDGTTAATGTVTLNGVVSGDAVGTTGTVFTFDNRNAGTGKTVTVAGTTLSGADAGNYTLTPLAGTATADVLKKALTGTVTANSRTYDGTTGATGTVTLNGVVSGDTVGTSGSVFSFANKAAGAAKTVTVSGTILTGADAGNYTLSVGTGVADILQKALTATVTVNNKTYDGTTAGTGSVVLNGVVQGDTVGTTGSVFTFDSRNAGTGRTVTITGTTLTGADAGNYTVAVGNGVADILKKALTGTISVTPKTYDGTTSGSGTVTLNGVIQGDSVNTTGTVFTYDNRNAGTGKTVTISGTTTLTGADAGNYTLDPIASSALGDILKKGLTLGVTIDTRIYDGTTNATGTVVLNGVVQGETVGITGTVLAFANKNAGTGKAVNVTGTTLTGSDAGNYTLILPTNVVGDILKLGINGTVTVNNKTYDGTSAGTGTVSISGVLQGDSVGTTGTIFTFDSRNAGTGRTVTITGTTLTGADAGNYTLTLPASAFADILKRSITGTVTITARQYDGTTNATGTVVLNGVVQGDAVGTTGTVLTYDNRNAGTGKTVTVSGTALNGADAGNYTLIMPATTLGDILRRQVSVRADDKEKYRDAADPMLTFTITSGTLVSGDAFSGGLVRAPGEAPGSYAISIGSLSLGDNYTLVFSPGMLTIVLDPASNQQQILKAIPLPSQVATPAAPGSDVIVDKDALCGDDAGCVIQ